MLTITSPRGDTCTWSITLRTDITGWTPRLTVKPWSGWASLPDASAAVSLAVGSGLVGHQRI